MSTPIQDKLEFINESFVLPELQTQFTGKDAKSSTSSFIYTLLDYSRFTTSGTPAGSAPFITDTEVKKLYLKKYGGLFNLITYSGADVAEASGVLRSSKSWQITKPNITPTELLTSEYNFSKLLGENINTTGYTSFKGTAVSLLEILESLRMAYNILDPSTFQEYQLKKKGNASTLDIGILKYTLALKTGSTTDYVSTTETNINTIETVVKPIIDITKIDLNTTRVEAVRRLILLYESYIHVYLGLLLLSKTSTGTDARVVMYDICYDMVKQFIERNNVIENIGGNVYNVIKDLEQRMQLYKKTRKGIEEENTQLQNLKTDIRLEKDLLNISNGYSKKTNGIFYAYLASTLIVIVGVIVIFYSPTLSDGMKKLFMSIMAGISVIAYIVLYLVNRYVLMETFSSASVLPAFLSISTIKAAANLDTQITDLSTIFNRESLVYLNNTINMVLLMDSYRGYGNVNYSMQKEHQYYKDKNDTLTQDKNKINQAHRVTYLNSRVNRYRVYYFLQLLLTITITAFLTTYFPDMLTFFTIIAVLLIIMFTYFYIINVNNLVRTDGKKLYWGQPNLNNMQY
jgi:hypothetical protein